MEPPKLAVGNVAIVVLANAIATGAMLYVIIITLGPVFRHVLIGR